MNSGNFAPECPVCFDPMIKDLSTTNCGHIFHFAWYIKIKVFSLKRALQGNRICPICRTKITNNTKIHYEIKTPRKTLEKEKTSLENDKKEEFDESISTTRKLIEENIKLGDENQRLKDLINEIKKRYGDLQKEIDLKITEFSDICSQNKDLKNKLISCKFRLEDKENINREFKERIDKRNEEITFLKTKIDDYENKKKLYEDFNKLNEEFEQNCEKDIDYKDIVKKYIKEDGEKSLALYIYTLNIKVKNFREESEKLKTQLQKKNSREGNYLESLSNKDILGLLTTGDNRENRNLKDNHKLNHTFKKDNQDNLYIAKKRNHNEMLDDNKKLNQDFTTIRENEAPSSKIKKIDNSRANNINYDFSKYCLSNKEENIESSLNGISKLKKKINDIKALNIHYQKNESNDKTNIIDDYVIDFVFDDTLDKNDKASNKINFPNPGSIHGNFIKSNPIFNEDKSKINDNKKNQNQKTSFDNLKIHDFLHSRHSDSRDQNIVLTNDSNNLNKINLNKNNINISNNPFLNLKNSFINKKK